MGREADPPPKYALRCPREGHTEISVRRHWFWCGGCGRGADPAAGRYDQVVDDRDRSELDHAEFVDRWGYHVYRGRSI